MIKTRAVAPAVLGSIAVARAAQVYGYLSWEFWSSFLAVGAGVTVLSLLTVRVRLATADDWDPPPPVEPWNPPPGPPPHDPHFRGSSGPPPRSGSS